MAAVARVEETSVPAPQIRPPDYDTAPDAATEESKRKADRAKARWAILRSALLGKSNPAGGGGDAGRGEGEASTTIDASIHRFRGFRMVDRRVAEGGLRDCRREDAAGAGPSMEDDDNGDDYECAEYAIPLRPVGEEESSSSSLQASSEPPTLRIRTRERKKRPRTKKVDVKALLSHRLHGVDNTGNVAVWDAESVLTHCLFRGVSGAGGLLPKGAPLGLENVLSLATPSVDEEAEGDERRTMLRVVELGAGMAGLASLALSALSREELTGCTGVSVDAVLTDGHPDCVANNAINVDLTAALHPRGNNNDGAAMTTVRSRRLMWDASPDGASACASLVSESNGMFDLVLASDCTHFSDFHSSLLGTLGRLLRVGGWAVLCQPQRGQSLCLFMDMIRAVNGTVAIEVVDVDKDSGSTQNVIVETGLLFEITLLEKYDERIWEMHESFLSKDDATYDPDIHYPLFLLLRKVRSYNEDIDTNKAVRHQEQRDSLK